MLKCTLCSLQERSSYELQESRVLPTIPCRLGERDLSASRGPGEKNTDSKGIINCCLVMHIEKVSTFLLTHRLTTLKR